MSAEAITPVEVVAAPARVVPAPAPARLGGHVALQAAAAGATGALVAGGLAALVRGVRAGGLRPRRRRRRRIRRDIVATRSFVIDVHLLD